MIFITTDTFLGAEGKDREDQIVENAVATVGDGANDLAIQLRVKTAGEACSTCLVTRGAVKYVLPSQL